MPSSLNISLFLFISFFHHKSVYSFNKIIFFFTKKYILKEKKIMQADLVRGGSGISVTLPFNGNFSKRQTKSLNNGQIQECAMKSETEPILRRMLHLFEESVIGKSITIHINEFGKSIRKPTPQMSDIISNEWTTFAKELVRSALTFGIAIWVPVKSLRLGGKIVPKILPLHKYRIEYFYVEHQRTWIVFPTDNFFVGNSSSSNSQPIQNANLVCIYEPTTEGNLTSPVSSVLRHIYNMEEKQENYHDADWSATHVPHTLVRNSGNRGGASSASGPPIPFEHFGSEDLGLEISRSAIIVDETLKQQLGEAELNALARKRGLNIQKVDEFTRQSYNTTRWNAWDNRLLLPSGISMITPPTPTIPNDYTQTMNLYLHMIALSFNIPSAMITIDHSIHAANEQMATSMFNSTIKSMQNRISPLIAEAYSLINGKSHIKEMNWKIENTEKVIGKTLSNQEVDHIYGNIRIEIGFSYSPPATMEQMIVLWQNEIISHETFAKHAIEIVGLNSNEILPESQRKREREERFLTTIPPQKDKDTKSTKSEKDKPKKQKTPSKDTKDSK